MAGEAALIGPVVKALMRVLEKRGDAAMKKNAEAAIKEAIRELLLANPNEDEVEAKLAVAKAAGLISSEVVVAERMFKQVRSHRRAKTTTRRKRAASRKAAKKKASKKKVSRKKTARRKKK